MMMHHLKFVDKQCKGMLCCPNLRRLCAASLCSPVMNIVHCIIGICGVVQVLAGGVW